MIHTRPTARARTPALASLTAAILAVMLAAGIAHATPITFTVTNTNDSGAGSLRQAITDANANPGADTIVFDIPATDPNCNGSGVCTIAPTSVLPDITEAVTIDGYSQPGASPNTLAADNNAALKIELSGAGITGGPFIEGGLHITVPGSVVKGLIINDWDGAGIRMRFGSSGNRIEGNYIGTDASGTSLMGNQYGVFVSNSPNNVVGGTSAASRNIIAGNDEEGVFVGGSQATGNRILRNSIFDNGELGIDLASTADPASGVTANDPGDPDTNDANRFQNFPVITSATTFDGETTIEGTLNSTANDTFNLQFFSSPAADPSGFGEGETFAGQTNVTTNSGGNVAFSFTTAAPISGGEVATATATNTITHDTSEFSEAVEVEDNTPPPAPQCDDGVDNDGDGKTDFPDDPGCASADDDSESPDPPPPPPTGCTVVGTSGDDFLPGTSGNDSICGLGGDDRISTGSGNDTVKGGDGNDVIYGGSGSNTLFGGPENDIVRGGSGNDDLVGGPGNDRLVGGPGADDMFGQGGRDRLDGRDGRPGDILSGGPGRDRCNSDKGDIKRSC